MSGHRPRMITPKEFRERVNNGARTFEEIDPELSRWLKRKKLQRMFVGFGAMLGIVTIWILASRVGAILWN